MKFLERKRSYGSGEGEVVLFEILITSYLIFEGNNLQMKKDQKKDRSLPTIIIIKYFVSKKNLCHVTTTTRIVS